MGLGLSACGAESGSGHVVGFLTVPACFEASEGVELCRSPAQDNLPDPGICESLDLGIDFFTMEREASEARIRLQHGGDDLARCDGLVFDLTDLTLLRGHLGVPLSVAPESSIRAALFLFERCPDSTESFELRGTVTFSEFGVGKGDRVAATIDELVVRDARTGALLGLLHGDFDFTVRRGPPYRRFSGQ